MAQTDTTEIRRILEEVRAQLRHLADRVEALEGKRPVVREQERTTGPEPISDEIIAAISACVGAYLGERVHIRQIRLLPSAAWAQQGRVSIQASHRLY